MNNFTEENQARYEELRRKGNAKTVQEKDEFQKLEQLKNFPDQNDKNASKKEEVVEVPKSQFEQLFAEIRELRKQVEDGAAKKDDMLTEGYVEDFEEDVVRTGKLRIWQPKTTDQPKIFIGWQFIGETYNQRGQLDLEYQFTLMSPDGKKEEVVMMYSTFAKINKFTPVTITDVNKKRVKKTYGKTKRVIQETNDQVITNEVAPLSVWEDRIMVTLESKVFGTLTIDSKYLNA